MAQHFTDDFIETVRESVDIVSVISSYLQIKKAGSSYKALCPFHLEKTPSFSISPQRQIFKCFSCSKAGNVFLFVMEMEGISFPEAVILLAEKHNIPIPEQKYKKEDVDYKKSRGVLDALNWSTIFFQRHLASQNGKLAQEYLKSRQISTETIERFQLGFAPDSWDSLHQEAISEGFTNDILLQAGLIVENKKKQSFYDRFRNRIMFPICNPQGKVVAFGGRVLSSDDQPKYLNSPETSLFSKKKTLYAFDVARSHISQEKSICVMEGYTDVLMAQQHGFVNTVATLGTALTVEHVNFVKKYINSVILVFDGDSAGLKATLRSLGYFLAQGIIVKIASPSNGLDPCEYLINHGKEAFTNMLVRAVDFFEFQLQQLRQKYDTDTVGGQRQIVRELMQTLAFIPDQITKKLYAKRIAEIFHLSLDQLLIELGIKKKSSGPIGLANMEFYKQKLFQDQEQFIIATILHDPQWKDRIFAVYPPDSFQDEKLAFLAAHINKIIQENQSVDIAAFSSHLEPEMGELVIKIYYSDSEENFANAEKIQERVKYILRGMERRKHKAKISKYKQMLQENSSDEDELNKILTDARDICKIRLREEI